MANQVKLTKHQIEVLERAAQYLKGAPTRTLATSITTIGKLMSYGFMVEVSEYHFNPRYVITPAGRDWLAAQRQPAAEPSSSVDVIATPVHAEAAPATAVLVAYNVGDRVLYRLYGEYTRCATVLSRHTLNAMGSIDAANGQPGFYANNADDEDTVLLEELDPDGHSVWGYDTDVIAVVAQLEAAPAPAQAFKVGDKVRLLPHSLATNGFVSELRDWGVVCRVRSVDDDGSIGVTVPGAGWFYFDADELEAVPAPVFVVGDKVRIVAHATTLTKIEIATRDENAVLAITKVHSDGEITAEWMLRGVKFIGFFTADELEHADDDDTITLTLDEFDALVGERDENGDVHAYEEEWQRALDRAVMNDEPEFSYAVYMERVYDKMDADAHTMQLRHDALEKANRELLLDLDPDVANELRLENAALTAKVAALRTGSKALTDAIIRIQELALFTPLNEPIGQDVIEVIEASMAQWSAATFWVIHDLPYAPPDDNDLDASSAKIAALESALRGIVSQPTKWQTSPDDGPRRCAFCFRWQMPNHAADCPIGRALALLETSTPDPEPPAPIGGGDLASDPRDDEAYPELPDATFTGEGARVNDPANFHGTFAQPAPKLVQRRIAAKELKPGDEILLNGKWVTVIDKRLNRGRPGGLDVRVKDDTPIHSILETRWISSFDDQRWDTKRKAA